MSETRFEISEFSKNSKFVIQVFEFFFQILLFQIKSALRVKSDEAEQQKLRAEMHESRAERISLESEEKSRKQQAEFDALKSEMDRKEKEHEKTMDAYKNEIKSLTGEFFREFQDFKVLKSTCTFHHFV